MVIKVKIKSYLRKIKGRKRRVRVRSYTRRKITKKREKRIKVKSYFRKVKGRKRRIHVKAYTRRISTKRKVKPKPKEEEEERSPEISKADISHWISEKDFDNPDLIIRDMIEAHKGKNAFYKALEDYYGQVGEKIKLVKVRSYFRKVKGKKIKVSGYIRRIKLEKKKKSKAKNQKRKRKSKRT
jgi:hypothetical protein